MIVHLIDDLHKKIHKKLQLIYKMIELYDEHLSIHLWEHANSRKSYPLVAFASIDSVLSRDFTDSLEFILFIFKNLINLFIYLFLILVLNDFI